MLNSMGNQSNNSNGANKSLDWPLYHSIKLPFDQEGFAKSFDINNYNPKEVKQFYDNFGVVVFDNILTEEQISKTIDDLWTETELIFQDKKRNIIIDRNDPKSWKFYGMQNTFGFVNDQPINQLQIWKNRANPKVYKAFKDLFEITSEKKLQQPLIACFDRASMMRPTKNNPQYLTKNIYHFDIDPQHWTGLRQKTIYNRYENTYEKFIHFSYMMGEGNYRKNIGHARLAGVLALSDTDQNSGGFEAALGFQNYIKKWCLKTAQDASIQDDKDLLSTFQKVPMRKGSLMIFTRQLPHNIYQNKSENFRYAQYLRMAPQSALILTPQMKQRRKQLINPLIPKQLQITDICKQVFMLDSKQNQKNEQN